MMPVLSKFVKRGGLVKLGTVLIILGIVLLSIYFLLF